jgi:hypothetical protein
MIARKYVTLAETILARLNDLDARRPEYSAAMRHVFNLSVPLASMVTYGYIESLTETGRYSLTETDAVLTHLQAFALDGTVPGNRAVGAALSATKADERDADERKAS